MQIRSTDINSIRRCPRCNALMRRVSELCSECDWIVNQNKPPGRAKDQRFTFFQMLINLGIPAEIWTLAGVCSVWLAVRLVVLGFSEGVMLGLVQLVFPLSFILFAETIGGFTGYVRGHYVAECPPSFVKFLGWLGLAALITVSCASMFAPP